MLKAPLQNKRYHTINYSEPANLADPCQIVVTHCWFFDEFEEENITVDDMASKFDKNIEEMPRWNYAV